MQCSLKTIIGVVSVLSIILAIATTLGGRIFVLCVILGPVFVATLLFALILFPEEILPFSKNARSRIRLAAISAVALPFVAYALLMTNSILAHGYNSRLATTRSIPPTQADLIEIARYKLNPDKWPSLDPYRYTVSTWGQDQAVLVATANYPGGHQLVIVDSDGLVLNVLKGQ